MVAFVGVSAWWLGGFGIFDGEGGGVVGVAGEFCGAVGAGGEVGLVVV